MTEPMKASGLPGAFVNCPTPYLVKCWSFLKGLSCQGTVAVCVTDEAWQCPCYGLSPQHTSGCRWGSTVALLLPQV